jgi:UDP-N-acetyl-D-galactosamine dehydrogenase
MANPAEVKHEYSLETTSILPIEKFDAVVLGVAHKSFLDMNLSILQKDTSILYDVKGIIGNEVDGKL